MKYVHGINKKDLSSAVFSIVYFKQNILYCKLQLKSTSASLQIVFLIFGF